MTDIKPMENKDIDKAAREYAEKLLTEHAIAVGAGGIDFDLMNTATASDFESFRNGAGWMKTQMQSEIDELVEVLGEATRWIPVPRDKDGFVDWDKFRLPKADAYICKRDGDYCTPYEACLEFTSEGDLYGVISVRPIDTPKATQLLEKYGKK